VLTLEIGSTWDGQPIGADERASVTLRLDFAGLHLAIDAPFHGDPPPAGAPGPTWALWEHEVVEVFVLGERERYTEIEIGPHGHHLVLTLDGRRTITARELPLAVSVSHEAGRWRADARLAAEFLPRGPHRVNAYAIHGLGLDRRYLCWTPVPGPAPDFHRLERFPAVSLGQTARS